MGDKDLSVTINRAPVLTLWAAVVAERLGLDQEEALTVGRAQSGPTAHAKGMRLGIFEVHPQTRCNGSAEQTDLPAPASCCLENAMTQQVESGTPAHRALDCFQVADLSFHRSGTPG
jgi:hypothetical protein